MASGINWAEKILSECIGEELPPCQAACPLDIRVREKLRLMQEGNLAGALDVVLERCPFPGILGRICSHPCESACTRGPLGGPIAIAGLKRHLADLFPDAALQVAAGPSRPQGVAVVGGGPAGLMAAFELRRLGYGVTLFEAEAALGGALRLYIPPHRLPREVLDRDLAVLAKLGVEVLLRTRLGRDVTLEELREDYAAVFLALGAQKSLSLGVAGESLAGVWPGLDFLQLANSGAPPRIGPRVMVIGGGNVAVDVARVARRAAGAQVTLICLESPEEIPAFPEEVVAAREEGVEILHRWGVKRLLGTDRVTGLELHGVAQVFDEQGRFAPVYQEENLRTLEADTVLVAIGQTADFSFYGPGLAFDTAATHRLPADPVTLETDTPGVFAGGDLVTGPRTAVEALAAGRRAALAVHAYLQKEPLPPDLPPLTSRTTALIVDTTGVTPATRQATSHLPVADRLGHADAEVDQGFSPAAAQEEAGRCLACVCSQCVKNCTYLQQYVHQYPYTEKEIVRLLQSRGESEPLIPYSCHYCGLCQAVCPQDLHAGQVCLAFRRTLVAQGRGPLPPHKGVQNYVKWGTSPLLTLTRPDPATGKARQVFFPGCSLPGYHPHLVRAAYGYLRERLPHTGIMLNCCGAPSHLLGEEEVLARVSGRVAAEFERLGAQELIAACTHCLHTLNEFHPEIKTRSLYEVMLELGLPEINQREEKAVLHVHEPCGARHMTPVQDAVRALVKACGHRVEEMAHNRERTICCGAGGLVPAVDNPLAKKMTAFRLSEAEHGLVSYCATCRAKFANAGRDSLHVLELLFNPGWQQAKSATPFSTTKRWWNRWRLQRYFQGL